MEKVRALKRSAESIKPNATNGKKRSRTLTVPVGEEFINEELFDAQMTTSPAQDVKIEKLSECFVSKTAQTGEPSKRSCGLIEVAVADQTYTISCFYCTEQFNIWNWADFVLHMKQEHHDMELAFVNSDALYVDGNCVMEPQEEALIMDILGQVEVKADEENCPLFVDIKEETKDGQVQVQNSIEDVTDTKDESRITRKASNKAKSKEPTKASNRKRNSKNDSFNIEEEDVLNIKDATINMIIIGRTDAAIVLDFLELLKSYPLLWYYRQKAQDYDNAVAELTQKLNKKWKLNITNYDMGKSLSFTKAWYRRKSQNKKTATTHDRQETEYLRKCEEITNIKDMILHSCDKCKSTFLDKIQLQVHRYRTHKLGELPFKCRRCNYKFADAERCQMHESKHEIVKERCFICSVCEKGFFSEKVLRQHAETHSEDHNPVCELCGEKFNCLRKFRKHKVYHDPPKYNCEICSKKCYQQWTLTEHMRVHHKQEMEYNHICKECGKTYRRLRSLLKHMSIVHEQLNDDEIGNSYATVEEDDI